MTSVVLVVVGFKTKKSLVFSIQCSPSTIHCCCPSSIEMVCFRLTRQCFRSFALLLYVVHVIYFFFFFFCSCSDNAIGSLSLVFVRMFIELCVECVQWTRQENRCSLLLVIDIYPSCARRVTQTEERGGERRCLSLDEIDHRVDCFICQHRHVKNVMSQRTAWT